jgi:N-acetylglucosamine kinase
MTHIIGIDIGGQTLKWRIFELRQGELVNFSGGDERPIPTGADSTARSTLESARAAIVARFPNVAESDLWIGVGAPGFIKRGKMLGTANLPAWTGTDFTQLMPDIFGVARSRVAVGNDTVCHTASVARHHPGQRVLCLTIGTGMAAGFAAGPRIITNDIGCGEIGHILADDDGYQGRLVGFSRRLPDAGCPCGTTGCVERTVSGPGLLRLAAYSAGAHGDTPLGDAISQGDDASQSSAAVAALARAGNEAAQDVFAYAGTVLANVVAPIRAFLNPNVLAVTGGVSRAFGLMQATVGRRLATHCFPGNPSLAAAYDMTFITYDAGEPGPDGAALLAFQKIVSRLDED